ncbi:MAG: LysR family transcriptional regulator [Firmicutes bacterium]|nr:LysR family transcriptional regulator [Bacillota bacterium]
MPDERLKTFLTVVRCGSLTGAAKELLISQPAVTLQIHKLEQEYNETLFYRRERGTELTPAGRVLYNFAQRIDSLYGEAQDELNSLRGEFHGILKVGATLTIGEYVLPPVMGRYKDGHPHTDILLEVENTGRIVEKVASGTLDCGLVEGPFENGMIKSEKLAGDELVFVCSSRHYPENIKEIEIHQLFTESFILREPGSGTRLVFENALRKAGFDPAELKILMQLGSTQSIKALVSENIGVTVISERTVQTEIRSGILKQIKIPSLDLHRSFEFIFKKDVRISSITRRFVKTCRDFLENPLQK